MTDIENQLIKHEGKKLKLYKDTVGKWTIGVGRNLDDVGISEDEALFMLRNDIVRVEIQIAKTLPFTVNLDRPRYYVLVNMAFNMGINGLLKFKNMLSYIQSGNFKNASIEMLNSKWAVQVGINRSTELALQMETGEFQA